MKLHLGCGKRDFGEGWIHIDCGDYPHVTSHDITKLPFPNNSCSLVYASHVIEYFDRDEIVPVLKEWSRVLRKGGKIRLAVPDFMAMARLYIESYNTVAPVRVWKIESFLGPLYGKMTPSGMDQAIYHRTAYDIHSIIELLENAGFWDIHRYQWRDTEHSSVDDHSQAHLPHMDKNYGTLISLNVEATKR